MESNENNILSFMHCRLCFDELMAEGGGSPAQYAKLAVGWTEKGLQVWCERHDVNVIHIDFEGHKHPADMSRIDHDEPQKH